MVDPTKMLIVTNKVIAIRGDTETPSQIPTGTNTAIKAINNIKMHNMKPMRGNASGSKE